ncbi:hypothetical protein XU18_2641 [Perkinsela sp. CCAP 1560/4]|nr:hypothetical protein XU18_2641 [Perkinsela sp. CCAP 1560/4]|eukprot:KNH06506.1 hypothetical protein XU18_2641 [Perkinsela sp. CCAP 1560/4]
MKTLQPLPEGLLNLTLNDDALVCTRRSFRSFKYYPMQLQMLAVVLFTASDDGVSKFDRSTLPQQNLMEFFIFGFDEPEKLCGSRENPNEGCRWRNATCNADREVNKFVWGRWWSG